MADSYQDDVGAPSRRQLLVNAASTVVAVASLSAPGLAQALGGGSLTAKTFAPFIGTGFLVTDDDDRQAILKLVQITTHVRDGRSVGLPDAFSLIFRSSPGTPELPSETYEVEDPGLGKLAMFIGPITQDPSYYEAPFN